MCMSARTWDEVLTTTIVNCFKIAKILATLQIGAINDSIYPFSYLKYWLDELIRRDFSLLQGNSAEGFVGFGSDFQRL